MGAHYRAMQILIVIAGAILLCGCAGKSTQSSVPEGCYRFDDGTPFFRIVGHTGFIIDNAGLKSFQVGPWKAQGREVEVTPAFILHDGTTSAPEGPARMAEAVTTLPSGGLGYRRANDQIIFSIPIEAYGWENVRLGKPC
jgi:hypothetical protein